MISLIKNFKQNKNIHKQSIFHLNTLLTNNNIIQPSSSSKTSIREYKSTSKQEIIPILIAGATIGVIGRYSYRAVQRMEEDWDDYLQELKIYNKEKETLYKSINYKSGFLGIDIGTNTIHISYQKDDKAKPIIIEDRTGLRYTPSYCYDGDGDDNVLIGQLAKSKLYEKSNNDTNDNAAVYNPRSTMNKNGLELLLRPIVTNALNQQINDSKSSNNDVLFGKDGGGYAVRPIITYPTSGNTTNKNDLLSLYKSVMKKISHDASNPLYIPEPIAIYKSLLHYNIIKEQDQEQPILIIDIGGDILQTTLLQTTTTTSSNNTKIPKVVYESCIPIGSNLLKKAIVSILIKNFYNFSSIKELKDNLALQRLYDASDVALLDLTNKNRTTISLPFLSLESDMKTPKHLDIGLSLDVLFQEVDYIIQNSVNNDKNDDDDNNYVSLPSNDSILSTNIPIPNNLSTLLSSYIMKTIFENTTSTTTQMITPYQLNKVIIVGGASKSPIYKKSIKDAFTMLGVFDEKLIFVNDIKKKDGDYDCDELCSLGAVIYGSCSD